MARASDGLPGWCFPISSRGAARDFLSGYFFHSSLGTSLELGPCVWAPTGAAQAESNRTSNPAVSTHRIIGS
jgi:hypothetical protein